MYSFIVSLEDGKCSKDRQKKKQLFKEKIGSDHIHRQLDNA